jgi:predicted nucleic acid-binding Zn ribbon protein
MTRSGFPEPIGEEVRRELKRFGPTGAMAEIVRAWPRVVGEAIARNAWPARVARDGTLNVATSSSAWAFELGLLEPDIRARLSAVLGPDAPTGLRFAPGRLPEPSSDVPPAEAARGSRPSASDRREAERLAARIDDENLRKLVAKAAAASLARSPKPPDRLLD